MKSFIHSSNKIIMTHALKVLFLRKVDVWVSFPTCQMFALKQKGSAAFSRTTEDFKMF